jgi:hypothetical protein
MGVIAGRREVVEEFHHSKTTLQADYAALSLASEIAPLLSPQSGRVTEIRILTYTVNDSPRPFKALRVSRLKAAKAVGA